MPRSRRHLLLALMLGVACLPALTQGGASRPPAELKVVSRAELMPVLAALAPDIEELTGSILVIHTNATASQPFDVIIADEWTVEALKRSGKVAAGGLSCIAYTGLSMVVPAGDGKPDIATVEGLRQALLAARSIAIAGSQLSGAQFRAVLSEIGIADQVEPKLVDTGDQHPVQSVMTGAADLGIALQSVIAAQGIQSAGPLPPDVQKFTAFFAAISSETAEPERAERLVDFLSSFDAIKALHAVGLDTALTE